MTSLPNRLSHALARTMLLGLALWGVAAAGAEADPLLAGAFEVDANGNPEGWVIAPGHQDKVLDWFRWAGEARRQSNPGMTPMTSPPHAGFREGPRRQPVLVLRSGHLA